MNIQSNSLKQQSLEQLLVRQPISGSKEHVSRLRHQVKSAASTETIAERQTVTDVYDKKDVKALKSLYKSQKKEYQCWIGEDMIDGEIPQDLEGSLFMNGPGLYDVGGKPIAHPFDGDGYVRRMCFKNGRAHFASRYVRTTGFQREQAAQKILYQSVFSPPEPSLIPRNPADVTNNVKNPSNTGLLYHGGRLLSLNEGGSPYELDPRTLGTVGEYTLPGVPKGGFTAHYRREMGVGAPVIMMQSMSGLDMDLTFAELDKEGDVAAQTTATIKGGAFGFYHDFSMCEEYYIVVQNPMKMSLLRLLGYVFNRQSLGQCLVMDENAPLRIHLIPRANSAKAGSPPIVLPITTYPRFVFHHVNAFVSEASGKVVMDMLGIHYQDFNLNLANIDTDTFEFASNARNDHLRVVHDPATNTTRVHQLQKRAIDFPCVNPLFSAKPHSVVFHLGGRFEHESKWGFAQHISKVIIPPSVGVDDGGAEVETTCAEVWDAGKYAYCSEPTFVPRGDGSGAEDDGWVLAYVFDGERGETKFVVLDGQALSAGPVCRVKLPDAMPASLHGTWVGGQWFGPDLKENNGQSDVKFECIK